MSEPDYLAHVTGAADPAHRPRRTLTGAVLTVGVALSLLVALAEPLLVAAVMTTALVVAAGGRRLLARGARRQRRRLCLPGTGVCVDY